MKDGVLKDRIEPLPNPQGGLRDARLKIDQRSEQLRPVHFRDWLVPERRRNVDLKGSDPLRRVFGAARAFDHPLVVGAGHAGQCSALALRGGLFLIKSFAGTLPLQRLSLDRIDPACQELARLVCGLAGGVRDLPAAAIVSRCAAPSPIARRTPAGLVNRNSQRAQPV